MRVSTFDAKALQVVVIPKRVKAIMSIVRADSSSINFPIIKALPVAESILAIKIKETEGTDNSKCSLMLGKAILIADKSIRTIKAAIFMAINKRDWAFIFFFSSAVKSKQSSKTCSQQFTYFVFFL